MAGDSPNATTFDYIYCYNITTDQYKRLPSPGHYMGILQIIDGKLAVIGGRNNLTNQATKSVSTYINNCWANHYPNLLRARFQPGVVCHSEYVIVAGGQREKHNINDDIEVLNALQPSQWIVASILLPKPMWAILPTITSNIIYIVGYNTSEGTMSSKAYQIPVDVITSSTTQKSTSDEPVQWLQLTSSPHYDARPLSNSHPPVIVGGHNLQGVLTSDISMFHHTTNTWKKISSLSNPRKCVAAISINSDTLLVLGGYSRAQYTPGTIDYISTVEKGTVSFKHSKVSVCS